MIRQTNRQTHKQRLQLYIHRYVIHEYSGRRTTSPNYPKREPAHLPSSLELLISTNINYNKNDVFRHKKTTIK